MRRTWLLTVMAILAVGLIAVRGLVGAAAQDAATQGHPLVGTWLVDADPNDPANPPDTFVFTGDGGFVEKDADGTVELGAWRATGAATADLTVISPETSEQGNPSGTVKIRAAIEVGADGDSFTAQYTLEYVGADGTSTGEAGPGQATGERLAVEAPGTPVMSFEQFFGLDAGTPEATPAA